MIHRISTSIFHASLGAFLAEGGAIITSFTPECQAVDVKNPQALPRFSLVRQELNFQYGQEGKGPSGALDESSERRSFVSSAFRRIRDKNRQATRGKKRIRHAARGLHLKRKSLATTYSPTPRGSTIGVGELNFRVRNGNGCGLSTIITRQK